MFSVLFDVSYAKLVDGNSTDIDRDMRFDFNPSIP
jgi:hypothetical protein